MIRTEPIPRHRTIAGLLPSDAFFWTALAVIAAIVPVWGRAVSVDITGFPQVAGIVAAVLLLRAAYVMLRPDAVVIHALLENGAAIVAYTALLATVSYFCGRSPFPLVDSALAAADRFMGYDWQAWADFENGIPVLALVLRLAYASLLPQIVLALVLLPLIGDGFRGYGLLRGSVIAACIACAGSWAMPAFGPSPIGAEWLPHWAALHTAAPFTASLSELQGIIEFPSFHASLAVLIFYAFRGLGAGTWLIGSIEAVMLVSTTTYGRHYLFDVVAGVATAVCAIALTTRLELRFPLKLPNAARQSAALVTV